MTARIAALVRAEADAVRQQWHLSAHSERVLMDIATCRTAVRGGHVEKCASDCGHAHPRYNSCRNRHCPQCQGDKQRQWVQARLERVVAVGHHQVVFTVPEELREASWCFPEVMHGLLFGAAAETLNQLGATRLGARIGFTAVLHTWARDLSYHPHVHCLVSGGGLRDGGADAEPVWVDAQCYLFPVSVMRRVYRAKFFDALCKAHHEGLVRFDDDPGQSGRMLAKLKRKLGAKSWVVFVEPPGDRPVQQALRYLGQYVYRVAISDHRLVAVTGSQVTFRTRGTRTCTLSRKEFTRRLLLHVLPRGLRKVRHYGLYAPANAKRCAVARELVTGAPPTASPSPSPPSSPATPSTSAPAAPARTCPRCGAPLVVVTVAEWLETLDDATWHRLVTAMLPWDDL